MDRNRSIRGETSTADLQDYVYRSLSNVDSKKIAFYRLVTVRDWFQLRVSHVPSSCQVVFIVRPQRMDGTVCLM